MRTTPPSALYLHSGPGGNCDAERAWYGGTLPVSWWEQPRLPEGEPHGFARTVEAAVGELARLAEDLGERIDVLGFACGCDIAHELALRCPEWIESLTLLAPLPPSPWYMHSYARRVIAAGAAPAPLLGALEIAERLPRLEAHWRLLGALAGVPGLLDRLWKKDHDHLRERWDVVRRGRPYNDGPTHAAMLHDFLSREVDADPVPFPRTVRVLRGRHDPLLDPRPDGVDPWARRYPGAHVEWVDAAHMIPFELPPDAWMPRRASARRTLRLEGGPAVG